LDKEGLTLTQAMDEFNKKFALNTLNIINSPAGSGKTYYIFNKFLENTYKYINYGSKKQYINELNKILYICDTSMLKDSVLKETEEKCITKILEKGDLKRAMKDNTFEDMLEGNVGHIIVITYASLSFLLKSKACKSIINKYFECIIMDEIHNLFKYANRFDNEENKTYETIIDYLHTLAQNLLTIGISATPNKVYQGLQMRELCVSYTTLFSAKELKSIKRYTNKYIFKFNHAINQVKWLGTIREELLKKNYKILIYTNTVSCCKKYKEMLNSYGYNAEWLCSINNKYTDVETGEIKKRMSEKQIQLKDKLLDDGILPSTINVLIINGAYETGWNLRDEKVQVVIIDNLEEDTQVQARNRVRNNMLYLRIKVPTDSNGEILEYDQYKNIYPTGECVSQIILASCIEDKYIGVKLSSKDKKYLVEKYAIQWSDKKYINWNTFKKDLDKCGFIVKTTKKHGTYIYKKNKVPTINKEEGVKRMNNEEKLIHWIENDWDKKRRAIEDIRDILDIGSRSFTRIINNVKFLEFLKDNRLKISTIKDGKVKYLYKF